MEDRDWTPTAKGLLPGNAAAIPGTPEGRAGVWLITPATAASLVKATPGEFVHNFLGSGPFFGADWGKSDVLDLIARPDITLALVFPPNCTLRHQLVGINVKCRWAFDVGEIVEERMVHRG